jgi:hypothetical protein
MRTQAKERAEQQKYSRSFRENTTESCFFPKKELEPFCLVILLRLAAERHRL